jgi:hypothetical protein
MEKEIKIRKLPPVWFIRCIDRFRSGLLWLNRSLFPGSVVLYERFQSLWLLPSLKVAAELDIAGILEEKPRTAGELATFTGSNEVNLSRLMRALASQGIFKLRSDLKYVNTSLSKPLLDHQPGSLRYMILHHLGEINWNALGHLSYAVKTGGDAFSDLHGKRIYDFLKEHTEESGRFDRSMTNLSQLAIEPLLSVYDFSRYPIIADIGGGEGLLLSAILMKNNASKGILFDLLESVNKAPQIVQQYGIGDRLSIVPGSFFETAIPPADAYLLKNILHNWSDEECIQILSNIRKVMPDKGKVLIIEMVIRNDNSFSYGKLIDIQMMAIMKEGKERTQEAYEFLLERSGLVLEKVIPTIAPFSIIEAKKI